MYSMRLADILTVNVLSPTCEELLCLVDGEKQKAINYTTLTGPAAPGQRVVLNVTAVELGLGSGGYHFVYLNLEHAEKKKGGGGHLVKLRYTPAQIRVLALEEEESPHHEVMRKAETLENMPVIVAELHSMLAPAVLTVKNENGAARIAYLMTDGGALPAYFSHTIRTLRGKGLLESVITCGHAFGGDLEAINVFSGLLAARHVIKADLAVVCMGPGVAGTGTPFGFSGIEMGENINRVNILAGRAVALPRISFKDRRSRHEGISHHTLTALGRVALSAADLPVPRLSGEQGELLSRQLQEAKLFYKHRIFWLEDISLQHLEENRHLCSTMGRGLHQDEPFFLAAAAAGMHAAGLLQASAAGRQ